MAPPRDETGDEAYARRMALSSGSGHAPTSDFSSSSSRPPPPAQTFVPAAPAPVPPREETGDEAYARRVAMSHRREETGEEAYQRRMAFSRGAAPPPSFVASSHAQAGPAPPFVPPPPPPGFVPPPAGFAPPAFLAASAPPPAAMPYQQPIDSAEAPTAPPPPPPAAGAPSGTEALDAAQAKAREIAAKLSKLGGAFGGAAPPTSAVGAAPSLPAPSQGVGMNPEAPTFAPASTTAGGAANLSAGPPAECVSLLSHLIIRSLRRKLAACSVIDTLDDLPTADPTTAALPSE